MKIVDLDRLSAADLAHLAAIRRELERPHAVDPEATAEDVVARLERGDFSPRALGW